MMKKLVINHTRDVCPLQGIAVHFPLIMAEIHFIFELTHAKGHGYFRILEAE